MPNPLQHVSETHHAATFYSLENPVKQSDRGANTDRHRIAFQLENGSSSRQLEAVVGASRIAGTKVDDSLSSLGKRLVDSYERQSHLVNFASKRSLERISGTSSQPLRSTSSSLIEQILAQLHQRPEGVMLNQEIALRAVSWTFRTDDQGLNYISGTISLQAWKRGVSETRNINFCEFYPDYNGKSLNAEVLLAALDKLPESAPVTNPSTQMPTGGAAANGLEHPHFYSAKGIGRSASLAVLYSFQKLCEGQNPFTPHEVQCRLKQLIEQGRSQRHKSFVNSSEQERELLKACLVINEQMIRPAESASTLNVEPPLNTRVEESSRHTKVSDEIMALATNSPHYLEDKTPYMPIHLDGIQVIAANSEYQFPELNKEQAKAIAKDIIEAGFYGDALGADLESCMFRQHARTRHIRTTREEMLFNHMNRGDKAEYRVVAQSDPTKADELLIKQLKKQNLRGHSATDDTQQGALSAIAKVNWMKTCQTDLNHLGGRLLNAFRNPHYPHCNTSSHQPMAKPFVIRGGADTLSMCQNRARALLPWYDVCAYSENFNGVKSRAGGAGNGAMMRIGYDLLPLLASGASTKELIEQALISNQVTHPSSFSAVASVGQVLLMLKCIQLRLEAETRPDKKLSIPDGFFINTFHEVAQALEHREIKFQLDRRYSIVPVGYTPNEWRIARLPSEYLIADVNSADSIKAGSVKQALLETQNSQNTSAELDAVIKHWSSDAYLGSTFPTVVFLLEKFGYKNPAHAVNMAALVTKDSDTCATIIAQVMGALHGSDWVHKEMEDAAPFHRNLGNQPNEFTVENFIAHLADFYDLRAN